MKRLFLAILMVLAAPAFAQDAPQATAVPQSAAQVKLSYAPVVKQVTPAVVNIYTKHTVQSAGFANPFADDPFFSQFFAGMSPMRKRVEQSLGSGFIIDPSGLIVTNAHVINDADEIMVVLSDGREFAAKSVLVDKPSDVALLRIDAKGATLPIVTFGDSEGLQVGDLVLAVGNPFGVGQTVTSGIVSALARSNTSINDFDFFIQTDAAINPGNSGGPLVDMDGHVVGVNSAIYSRSGGSLGIGFAIPSEMVQAVIAAEKTGQVSKRGVMRAWLGFTAQSMNADIANSLGFDHPQGALIADITPDGPADKAGLRRGDVITAIGGHPIRDAEELKFRIATLPLGQQTTLSVKRDGQDETLTFTADKPAEIPPRNPVTVDGKNPLEGATVINVSPAVIEDMGLANQTDGVVVQAVRKGSVADRMGLDVGDGIIAIGERKVTDTTRLSDLLSTPPERGWILTIRRDGRDQTIILR
jgi:serine protease Do